MSLEKCIHTCNHHANQLVIVGVIQPDSTSESLNHVSMRGFMTLLGEYDFYTHNRDNSSPIEEIRK